MNQTDLDLYIWKKRYPLTFAFTVVSMRLLWLAFKTAIVAGTLFLIWKYVK